jgi:hypothetical protein
MAPSTPPSIARSPLAYDQPRGPLIAVAGLCGGAGATTLTYLLACAAAGASRAPVLAMDCGGQGAMLSLYAGAGSPYNLETASQRLDQGAVLDKALFVVGRFGLRLLCSGHTGTAARPPAVDAARRMLCDAQHAHGATLVDCGTGALALQRLALENATHILWVLPANVGAVARATRVLTCMPHGASEREIIVARQCSDGGRASLHGLDALAESRGAAIAMLPLLPDILESGVDVTLGAADDILDDLGRVLCR